MPASRIIVTMHQSQGVANTFIQETGRSYALLSYTIMALLRAIRTMHRTSGNSKALHQVKATFLLAIFNSYDNE